MHRARRRALASFAVLAVGVWPMLGGAQSASAAEDPDVPEHTIDLDELPAGGEPATPWIQDDTIRTPDAELPVDPDLELTAFTPVGPTAFVGIDDLTGDGMHNRLVRIDQDGVTELAGDHVSTFATSADNDLVAWSEWSDENESGRVVLAETDSGDIVDTEPTGGQTYVIGFAGERVVLQDVDNQTPQSWTPGSGIEEIPGTFRATATQPELGLASIVTEYIEEPDGWLTPCSTVFDTTNDFEELWTSCEVVPRSFSPEGRYVWAQDVETDDALPASMFLVDAETGDKILHIEIEGTTQRMTWEPGGSVLFDAWTGGSMAIVRCATAVDDGCELATEPRPHDEPIADDLPYLLAELH